MSQKLQNGSDSAPKGPEDLEMRDFFALLAPISLQDAIKHSGLRNSQTEDITLEHQSTRAAVLALLAMMRYEYADAMLEARKKAGA